MHICCVRKGPSHALKREWKNFTGWGYVWPFSWHILSCLWFISQIARLNIIHELRGELHNSSFPNISRSFSSRVPLTMTCCGKWCNIYPSFSLIRYPDWWYVSPLHQFTHWLTFWFVLGYFRTVPPLTLNDGISKHCGLISSFSHSSHTLPAHHIHSTSRLSIAFRLS